MFDATKTIAFRVSPAIDAQIEEIAKAQGLTKSQWVRDQVMQAVHATSPPGEDEPSAEKDRLTPDVARAIENRILEFAGTLREDILAVKTSIEQAAKDHHDDLMTVTQVGLAVEESMEQRIDDRCADVMDAIKRLKQSQRSHKDTVLRAIHES